MFADEELIQKCKDLNPLAQRVLYDKYNALLLGVCLRYANNSTDADDIFQDGFMKILTKIDKYKWQGKGSFEAWLKTVMANTAISYYHKNKKQSTVEYIDNIHDVEEDEEPEELNNDDFSQSELLEALNKIPEEFRLVFNMHVLEGLKHEEIAEKLDIKIRTSRTRLLRARKKIQKELVRISKNKHVKIDG